MGVILARNFIDKSQELHEQHLQLSEKAAMEIETFLDKQRLALETLAQQIIQGDIIEPNRLYYMIQGVNIQYPSMQEILLLNPEYTISSVDGLLEPLQVTEKNQLLALVLEKLPLEDFENSYLSPQIEITEGQQASFLVVRIVDQENVFWGYLIGRLDPQTFLKFLNKYQVYPSCYATLMDSNMEIVITTYEGGKEALIVGPIGDSLRAGVSGTLDYFSPVKGQREIAGFTTVGDQGWGLWIAAARNEIMRPQYRVATISLLFILLSMGVVLFIRRLIVNHITQPLVILDMASQELAEGNLSFRVVMPQNYPAEIRHLGQRFNRMATSLEHSNNLARMHSAELELRVKERTAELLMKNKGLAALYAVASLVTSDDASVSTMLITALKKAMNLFGADAGGFYLERIGLGRLTYTVKSRLVGPLPNEEGLLKELYFSSKQAILNTYTRRKTLTLSEEVNYHLAVIPIPNLLRNLGALTLARTEEWKDGELVILYAMCKQLGVVVSNLSMNKYINEQNSTLLAVMSSIHEGLILYNADGIIFANQVFVEMFNLQGLEIQNLSVQKLKEQIREKGNGAKILIDLWENFIKYFGYDQQVISYKDNDKTKYYQTYYFPVNATEVYIGFGCLVRDITKEKEVELLKNTILSTVSHELRTPLTTIRGSAESLLRKDVSWPVEDKEEFLKAIVEESQRLRELIDNIMDMSKIEAGALNLDIQSVDICKLINRVVKRFRLRFPKIVFDLKYEKDLPLALVDEGRIDQVLSNLIENGIKYSSEESTITISARHLPQSKMLELVVKDQGIGIDPFYHRDIFTHFYRVKNKSAKNISGSGVGLSIAKGIIDAHGGSIWVESQVGQGSSFYVTIPCEEYKGE